MKIYRYVACLLILCMAIFANLCGCVTINIESQSNGETQAGSESETDRITAKEPETTVEKNGYSFNTVADLIAVIKSDPYKYANKEVHVKGTLVKCEADSYSSLSDILALIDINEPLPDYNGVELRYQLKNNPCVNIKITDDILYTVAEHNDYVHIRGIVKISNGEIYLDNCTLLYEDS